MSKKFTYEFVKSEFEKRCWKLLDTDYINSNTQLKYECNNGHINYITYGNFKNGDKCPKCVTEKHKLSFDYVNSKFKERGYNLLETEYINSNTKMKYICDKGHENYIRWRSFNNGNGCKDCFKSLKKNNKKLDYDFVKSKFEERNYILLDFEYINANTKMKYSCDKGHECYITYGNLKLGKGCKICANSSKKLTYKFVKSEFKKRGYLLLETEYSNNRTTLKYLCNEGHINYIKWNDFQQGHGCKKCSNILVGSKQRYSFNFIKSKFEERSYTLLETEYINNNTKMKYKCSKGHVCYITYSNLKLGYGCRKCGYMKISGNNHPNWNEDRELIKLKNNIAKRCARLLSRTLKETNQNKLLKTKDILGYTNKQLLEHLQSFSNWNDLKEQNWHIDHIIPIKAFVDHNVTDLKIINHLSNLQPLSSKDNFSKNCKYTEDDYIDYMKQFKKSI